MWKNSNGVSERGVRREKNRVKNVSRCERSLKATWEEAASYSREAWNGRTHSLWAKKNKKRIQQDMNCEWKGFDDDESSQTKRGRNFGYSLTCTTNLNERLSESLSRRPKFDRALAVYLFLVRVILKLPASVWIGLLRNNKEASLAKCPSKIVLHAVFAIWNGE